MATILLQVAGSFIGGLFGPVGAVLGTAAGALAGNVIDNALIASTRRYEGPRLDAMQPFTAEEGKAVPRIYGTARVAGTLIWATRFEEERRTERQGAKGGPKVTTYSYFGNFAFALCEGEIAGVRRIWADGRELDQTTVQMRVYRGTEGQQPAPLIEARQGAGNAPAYKGTAYVVFERFPLDAYGNRIPQIQFEVLRPIGALEKEVTAVCLIPGSTEFGLAPYPVRETVIAGETRQKNRHVSFAATDWEASIDELQALCPNLKHVALVVTWFGANLDAAQCAIRPMLSNIPAGVSWGVNGYTGATAPLVSRVDGRPAFGGTPDDASVVAAIADLRNRGLKVTLYPFVLMDIPADNALADPYGAPTQAAYPWRGRITCDPAPGRAGTPDKSAAIADIVSSFCGSAAAGNFSVSGGQAVYSGAAGDTGYRRFILHCANLCRAAGGVDAFLIGSELRGLTTLRDNANAFPFVEALRTLAGDVAGMLGAQTKITYGADWSEYFGHHPRDGSGDVFFHLDRLWAHPAIAAVGIDNYMPLADWRDGDWDGNNPDGFLTPDDPDALKAQVFSGEGYDWFYANAANRDARIRTPVNDGAYGKPWVFRYKDIAAWWLNPHFNRIGGVEQASPTEWVPGSKPVWFTETGCPAVDKGANQPNVFPDPKSSESALPYFSNGGRSDLAAIRYARAQIRAWTEFSQSAHPANAMIDPERIYLWAWDARPFPSFPLDGGTWGDGANWSRGHWLNGRLGGAPVGDLIAAILAEHGVDDADTRRCGGFVDGYTVADVAAARGVLEPLLGAFAIRANEAGGTLVFSNAAAKPVLTIDAVETVTGFEWTQIAADDVPDTVTVSVRDMLREHQAVTGRAEERTSRNAAHTVLNLPVTAGQGVAQAVAGNILAALTAPNARAKFALPMQALDLEVGDALRCTDGALAGDYRITGVTDALERRFEAQRIWPYAPEPDRSGVPTLVQATAFVAGPPRVHLIDLPMVSAGQTPESRLRAAAWSKPWRPLQVAVSPGADGYVDRAALPFAASLGDVSAAPAGTFAGRTDRSAGLRVLMRNGALASVTRAALLNGANAAAVQGQSGAWEIVQFEKAEEVAPDEWALTGLLRGQLGTEDAGPILPGAPFVLLDDAVAPVGLAATEIGLALNFRFAPAGQPLDAETSLTLAAPGGVRALTPLAPVHVRWSAQSDGSVALAWTRRGRVDADSWEGEDIALGEEAERYRVEILNGAALARTAETSAPQWTYAAALIAADLGSASAAFTARIRQIGTAGRAGIPAALAVPARA